MRCLAVFLPIAILAACASDDIEISEQEREFIAIADAKTKGTGFPVLRDLPSEREVVDGGVPRGTGPELRARAAELSGLRIAETNTSGAADVSATAAELKALVERLRADPGIPTSIVDIEALGIPTPPPLD